MFFLFLCGSRTVGGEGVPEDEDILLQSKCALPESRDRGRA